MSVRKTQHLGMRAIGGALILVLVVPIVVLIGVSLNSGVEQVFPPRGLSLRWYENLANRSGFVEAARLTLMLAVGSALVSVLVSLCASVALTRFRFVGHDVVLTLLLSPLIVPQVVVGMGSRHPGGTRHFQLVYLAGAPSLRDYAALYGSRCAVRHEWRAEFPRAGRAIAGCHAVARVFPDHDSADCAGVGGRRNLRVRHLVRELYRVPVLGLDRTTLPVAIYTSVQTENDPTATALSSLIVLAVVLFIAIFNRFVAKHMFSGG